MRRRTVGDKSPKATPQRVAPTRPAPDTRVKKYSHCSIGVRARGGRAWRLQRHLTEGVFDDAPSARICSFHWDGGMQNFELIALTTSARSRGSVPLPMNCRTVAP
jgi:hypothetical protein